MLARRRDETTKFRHGRLLIDGEVMCGLLNSEQFVSWVRPHSPSIQHASTRGSVHTDATRPIQSARLHIGCAAVLPRAGIAASPIRPPVSFAALFQNAQPARAFRGKDAEEIAQYGREMVKKRSCRTRGCFHRVVDGDGELLVQRQRWLDRLRPFGERVLSVAFLHHHHLLPGLPRLDQPIGTVGQHVVHVVVQPLLRPPTPCSSCCH